MSDLEKLKQINEMKFKDQAVWMLNAMWPKDGDSKAEEIWKFVATFSELEQENHAEGKDLDEMNMHRVFEKLGNQLTMQEMRTHLRKIGVTQFKKISMINFLIFYYKYDTHEVVNAPQGANGAELEKAKKMLEEVTTLFNAATEKAQTSKAAAAESKKRADEAKKTAEACKEKQATATAAAEVAKKDEEVATQRQSEAQAAEEEVTKALNVVKSQEDAKNKKRAELQKKIETAGLVAKNAAIQELAKLDNEDDLPMRRAKTTLEAAQRKASKALKIATDAKDKATETAQKAEEAKQEADKAKEQADNAEQEAVEAEALAVKAAEEAESAVEEANAKVAEAEAYLAEQQQKATGAGQGAIWFMQREVTEKKKFMPVRKGGIAK
ncbi:Tropomyosin, putative [Entamoeba invadens IP1]|uniref:Tropomyosin, putative n=2 Tax=Entamoeba invadens TaxID=33085 RepID=A0A0A1U6H9_ENTIV|nr:Tropomyosin, putative [Entamoeba invadens IP1]ELP88475.1 Tropomyosin, putative [Entamoeba invadens IP1]BAN40760.1 tropomyosin, putative [Entamoeba invadens]|eukprot:XP_004255246.1 Tropomyosin, putative [Entamoeba invadens IP1]